MFPQTCKGVQLPYWNNHLFLVVWGSILWIQETAFLHVGRVEGEGRPPQIQPPRGPRWSSEARLPKGFRGGSDGLLGSPSPFLFFRKTQPVVNSQTDGFLGRVTFTSKTWIYICISMFCLFDDGFGMGSIAVFVV